MQSNNQKQIQDGSQEQGPSKLSIVFFLFVSLYLFVTSLLNYMMPNAFFLSGSTQGDTVLFSSFFTLASATVGVFIALGLLIKKHGVPAKLWGIGLTICIAAIVATLGIQRALSIGTATIAYDRAKTAIMSCTASQIYAMQLNVLQPATSNNAYLTVNYGDFQEVTLPYSYIDKLHQLVDSATTTTCKNKQPADSDIPLWDVDPIKTPTY